MLFIHMWLLFNLRKNLSEVYRTTRLSWNNSLICSLHKFYVSECFEKDEAGVTISNLTSTTLKFLSLADLTNACISNHEDESKNTSQIICDECKEDYLILNNYYNHHKAICMDVVDLVCNSITLYFHLLPIFLVNNIIIWQRPIVKIRNFVQHVHVIYRVESKRELVWLIFLCEKS